CICNRTRYTVIIHLKEKSDSLKAIQSFLLKVQNQFGVTVKRWRSDNAGEFRNKELTNLFASHGIILEDTPSYSPETLGVAERFNRTVVEMVRALHNASGLGKEFWAEVAAISTYLKNRLPHSAVKDQTPYEALTEIGRAHV